MTDRNETSVKDAITREMENLVSDIRMQVRNGLDLESIRKNLQRWNYSSEAIERGLALYRERHGASLGSGALLRGEKSKDRINWYCPVEIPDPTSAWGKLTKVLESRGWAKEHIKDLDHESNAVVSCLCPPNSEPQTVKGLVLGYVQSGKTANFSAVIAKATDEGYRLVIVLSGMYNNLRSQTERRLQSELTAPHSGANSFTLTSADSNGDFKMPTFEANSVLGSKEKFVLAVIKKNSTRFDILQEWLSRTSKEILEKSPVLIIDDEADQASVNNSTNRSERSAINRRIISLIEALSKNAIVSYVGYTATPFANILIDADEKSDLFPRDFIYALRAPDTYVGAERLFGRESLDGNSDKEGLDVIRYIGPEDVLQSDETDPKDELTPAMKQAILSFYLAGAERIRRRQTKERDHITMLFNTTHLVDGHQKLVNLIDLYQKQVKLGLQDDNQELISELRNLWANDFVKTTQSQFSGQEIGTFQDVLKCMLFFMEGLLPPIKENSQSTTRLNFEGRTWAIIVGGNTLSRGLTVEGLTVSYFHRTARGYDTLLQMGRWFGYRPGYLDLTRIFVTPEMEAHFYHLASVERELRDDIIRMQENDERPIDIALKIRAHDLLNITEKRVLKNNAVFASNTYSGTKLSSTHVFLNDHERSRKNFRAIQNLLEGLENAQLRVKNQFREFSRCLLYKKVNPTNIITLLNNYSFSPSDARFNFDLLSSYIKHLVKDGELTEWSVAVMSQNLTIEDHLIDLGVGDLKVYAVDRRQTEGLSIDHEDNGVTIKSVTSFRDELIDLDHLISTESIAKFIEEGDERQNIVTYRNKRDPKTPLLLIYPIYTNWQKSTAEREVLKAGRKLFPIISDIRELFAMTLVFPPTRQKRFNFDYVANASILRRTGGRTD